MHYLKKNYKLATLSRQYGGTAEIATVNVTILSADEKIREMRGKINKMAGKNLFACVCSRKCLVLVFGGFGCDMEFCHLKLIFIFKVKIFKSGY